MFNKVKLFVTLFFIFCIGIATAQEACDAIVQTAIETAASNCDGLRRNEACYGNVSIDAEASATVTDFTFDTAGDIVNVADIASMRLSSDIGNGDWGISLLSLRANMPDSVTNDVVMVLMGDLAINNAAYELIIPVTANSNTRLRSSPSTETDYNILIGINSGMTLDAFGRTENGEWLKVQTNGTTGWVAAIVVDGDSERMSLPVIDISAPYYGAMQAFTLQLGETDTSDCEDIPPDGIIIQTPEGSGMLEFRINEVSIRLGSTAFLTLTENALRTYLLEGKANIAAQGQRAFMPPGTYVDVPLNSTGDAPDGVPSNPLPYSADDVANIPVQLATSGDQPVITIAEPVPDGEVEAAIVETYISNPYGVIDGWYRVTVTSFEQVASNPFIDGYCASGGTVLNSLHTEFSNGFQWEIIVVESPTSFTFVGDNSDPSLGGCIARHRAVWVPEPPQ